MQQMDPIPIFLSLLLALVCDMVEFDDRPAGAANAVWLPLSCQSVPTLRGVPGDAIYGHAGL